MRKYPQLSPPATSREMLSSFGGYNHNLRARDNEFFDMQNMTSEFYPVLSPRKKRAVSSKKIDKPNGMIAKDALAYIDGNYLYYNEKRVEGMHLADSPKQLISMGVYILIFPDKMYYNTKNGEFGYLEAIYESAEGVEVSLSVCKKDGSGLGEYPVSPNAPEEPENASLWLDTSGDVHVLKQWSATTSMWTQVATTYLKLFVAGMPDTIFKVNDGITVSGLTGEAERFNNTYLVQAVGEDYIVIVGLIDKTVSLSNDENFQKVTIKRSIPEMDFLTESENRIWGCKYGMVDGKAVNEIFACALGDPFNWNQFRGTAADSYAVSLGSDGVFTGAITHGGYPIFFKENCIHKIYGNLPSNYQVLTTNCRGVQQGSHKSLVIVNETLYYKSARDICVYDGSLPGSISDALGQTAYKEAVAGAVDGRYYISMKDTTDNWSMFVYDTYKRLWHKEDDTHALEFATVRNQFFYIDADDNFIKSPTGDFEKKEDAFEWFVETGVIGYDLPDNKYNSRFNLRLSLDYDSVVKVFIEYDSSGKWELKGTLIGQNLRSFTLPVIPKRCDHIRLRITGVGECKIYSLTKVIEQGSDI